MAADIGEILTRRRTQDGIEVILETTPEGKWRGLIRENGGRRTTLNPGHLGFDTPGEAAEDTDRRITALLIGRTQAEAANVEYFLERGWVEKRPFAGEDGEEMRWAARREDDTWDEGHPTSRAAVRAALTPAQLAVEDIDAHAATAKVAK